VSRRIQVASLAALLAAVLTAAPSSAAGKPRLTEAAGARFPDRAFVLTLPSEQLLSASQVTVLENGKPVTRLSVVPAAAARRNQFGVVLILDASESMSGEPIAGALQAAQLFVGHRAPSQPVAILAFNSKTQVVLPFTTDSGKILQALARPPELAYGTHIYDAVDESISLLRDAKIAAGSIVLLSDGADTGSHATRATVADAAQQAHVRVFTVGLRSEYFDQATLRDLASAASGEYSEATSVTDLGRVYDRLGTQLAHEYLLQYKSLVGPGAAVHVAVKLNGVSGALRSGYRTPALPVPPVVRYDQSFTDSFWGSSFTMIVFSVFIVALLAATMMVLLMPRRRTVQRRLAEFVSIAQSADGKKIGGGLPERVIVNTEKSLEGSRWWKQFVEDVELADIRMKPAHIAVWTLVATVLVMWLFAVVFTVAAVVLGLLVPLIVWGAVRRKVEWKRSQFAEQLPDNLAVLASALRAGHSFVGALSVVVEDAPEPTRTEFRRVVADEQLGLPLEDALDVVVKRMKNDDLGQVALVAVLQRETGGSTAEVLDRVVETVRERQELRRLVRTLTAAGRFSRWVVTFLPVALVVLISLLAPGYLTPLFTHTTGRILIVFAAVLVIGGSLVIKKIVDIKV
jgi:tight adherence protein B